jgi:drug/metabolite transporter (DMT)-like permease
MQRQVQEQPMQMSDNARGAIYMSISQAAFTLNDTAMKVVAQTLPLFEAIALRGLLALTGLLVLGAAMGHLRFRVARRDGRMIALRCVAEVGATVLFLGALIHMPLANLSAIMQALPLAVTLAAAVVFRERIGWRRMVAILIGFAGVLIIIRPGSQGFDLWSVMGLGSVACVVVRDLATRRLSAAVPSVTVAIWAASSVTVMGLVVATVQGWQPVSGGQAVLVAAAGAALLFGYLFAVMVMRVGDISFVAPFRYSALLWAIFLGWLVFNTLPDQLTLFGAGLVVATGLFTLLRERRLKRRQMPARV